MKLNYSHSSTTKFCRCWFFCSMRSSYRRKVLNERDEVIWLAGKQWDECQSRRCFSFSSFSLVDGFSLSSACVRSLVARVIMVRLDMTCALSMRTSSDRLRFVSTIFFGHFRVSFSAFFRFRQRKTRFCQSHFSLLFINTISFSLQCLFIYN